MSPSRYRSYYSESTDDCRRMMVERMDVDFIA